MNKLKKAPLQEVILEVRWGSTAAVSAGGGGDSGYLLALGKFHGTVADKFPIVVKKFPIDVPWQIIGNQVHYQFWTNKNTWPVLQLGPGILTVNDTEKNYEWRQTFFPMVSEAIETLCKAYSVNMSFSSFSLRYIDVVKTKDYEFNNWPDFIKDHINFVFTNQFDTRGKLKNFSFDQVFELPDGGLLQIILSNGVGADQEDVFVLQTSVNQPLETNKDGLLKKIEAAHNHTSEIFKEICKKDFYASFN